MGNVTIWLYIKNIVGKNKTLFTTECNKNINKKEYTQFD